jgi:type IV pilus assembly protein PilV
VTLIEILVSLVVLAIGLLGIMQLYAAGQTSELEGQQHSQAMILVNDMVDRINANRTAAQCYNITDNAQYTDTDPWVGTGNQTDYSCSGVDRSATRKIADQDLGDWDNQLAGDTIQGGGSIVGARGCIYDNGTDDSYQIVVAWQGRSMRPDPAVDCAEGEYGGVNNAGESQRRAISRTVQMADLD